MIVRLLNSFVLGIVEDERIFYAIGNYVRLHKKPDRKETDDVLRKFII